MNMTSTISYRTCHLCEATCGLELHMEGNEIGLVRGDREDVFSHGYLCPKGTAIKQLETDPDRVRVADDPRGRRLARGHMGRSLRRDRTPASARSATRTATTRSRSYLGQPERAQPRSGRSTTACCCRRWAAANVYSASTVDQMPKQVSAGLMFGAALTIPVPDVDRTDYLLMLGANPFASNGSLMTAPDLPARLRALRARGGRLVVVDPRRTKTAEEADEHLAIRPGTDALFLFALVHVLFAEDLVDLGARRRPRQRARRRPRAAATDSRPKRVAQHTGIDADTIRRIARELATRAGGGGVRAHRDVHAGVRHARVVARRRPERAHRQPRPAGRRDVREAGDRRRQHRRQAGRRARRALRAPARRACAACPSSSASSRSSAWPRRSRRPAKVRSARCSRWPATRCVSTPDSDRLDRALASLEFMVSVDIYLNETTRHADVFLPAEPELARGHYDIALYSLAIRNVANYSPPVVELDPGALAEWQILLRLARDPRRSGRRRRYRCARRLRDHGPRAEGRDAHAGRTSKAATPDEILKELASRRGPERILDFMLRTGPYGDGFGADPDGLTLAQLEANPHGIDFGPLQPRIPDVLRTPTGMIELAPADLPRRRRPFARRARRAAIRTLVLVGRRDLRSNNSWMHNLPVLVKGKERCTLHVHPDDAAHAGVADGASVRRAVGRGRDRRPGRDHRRGAARRREPPARLGPRSTRAPA